MKEKINKIVSKAVSGGMRESLADLWFIESNFESIVMQSEFFKALGKSCGWIYSTFASTGINEFTRDRPTTITKEVWRFYAMKFHEKNLTEGWDEAVKYLSELVKEN